MHCLPNLLALPGIRRPPPRRFILSLFTVNMLWMPAAYSQRLSATFGPVAERPLGFAPAGLAIRIVASQPRAEIAVLAQSPPALHFFSLNDAGAIDSTGEVRLAAPLNGLMSAVMHGVGEPSFFGLTAEGTGVAVIAREGKRYAEKVVGIPNKAQHVAAADINNDGIPDLLVFGKGMAGVSTILGTRAGGFEPGPDLFTEISVSDLRILDINGDGINDAILCNWLSNQLTIFYGISRMVFSEQLTVSLPGEPEALATSWLPRKRWLGVAVTVPSDNRLVLLRGTPDGEFRIDGHVALGGKPSGVSFALVNGDTFPDLIIPTDRGTIVSLGAEQFGFLPPALLGPGAAPAGWGVADVDGDRKLDFVAAERNTQRLVILGNALHGDRTVWPAVYAVGSRPHGLAIRDYNGDGLPDIAVANSGSSSVSLLLNNGRGKFRGEYAVTVAEQPVHVAAGVPGTGWSRALVTSHPASEQIDVVTWESDPSSATSLSIPTGPRPYTMRAWSDSLSLRVLVRYPPRGDAPVSLSLFEQLGGRQFLERSLRASLPERLAAVTVDRASATSYTVSFISTDKTARASSVVEAPADRSFSLGQVRQILTFADSVSATRGLIPASLSVPGRRDLIIVFGKPVNALGLAYRTPEGAFRDSLEWIRNVRVEDDDDIVVEDVDGDGRPDITVRNDVREEVVTYYGSPGGFDPGVTICSARGVRAIAVAPLITPSQQDLILSHQAEGTVSIMFDPFRRAP